MICMYVCMYVECMPQSVSVANIDSLCIRIVTIVFQLLFHMLFKHNCCWLKIRLTMYLISEYGSNRRALMLSIHVHVSINSSIWFTAMHLEKVHCTYQRDTAYVISVLECTSVHENNIVFYLNKYSKTCLNWHSKKAKKLAFNTDYRLMQVKRFAEFSKRAFCNAFDLH